MADESGEHVVNIVHPSGNIETFKTNGYVLCLQREHGWEFGTCGLRGTDFIDGVVERLADLVNRIPTDDRPEWVLQFSQLIAACAPGER